LFDRGGRELPIQADFVGKEVVIPEEKVLKLETGPDNITIKDIVICGVKK
jgi:pyrimidine operon attenuation protein/uracil phosphoribosyltransferase